MAQIGSRSGEERYSNSSKNLLKRFGFAQGNTSFVWLLLIFFVIAFGGFFACTHLPSPSFAIERKDGSIEASSRITSAESPQTTQEASSANESASQALTQPSHFVVHIDGAVQVPGVYALDVAGARINDVVTLAGGLREDADTTSINLAQPIEDGMKIHIPALGDEVVPSAAETPVQAQTGTTSAGQASTGLININTASAAELEQLPGIGAVLAQSIVDERARGSFASVDDLTRVSGIGPAKLEKLRSHACV